MRYGKSALWLLEGGDRPANEAFYRECLPGVGICFVDGVRDFLDYAKYAGPDWLAVGSYTLKDIPYTERDIERSGGLCFSIIKDLMNDYGTKNKPVLIVSSLGSDPDYVARARTLGITILGKGDIGPEKLQRSVESLMTRRGI